MSILYILTFGSFIGFSMALPLSITVIFGFMNEVAADGTITRVANPNAPSALTYARIGPLHRRPDPSAGRLDLRQGRRLHRHPCDLGGDGHRLGRRRLRDAPAYGSAQPEEYFFLFPVLFPVLFAASGIGNGSTFRTIGVIYDREKAGPVLGWTSAVAAYGSFVAPIVIGEQVKAGTPKWRCTASRCSTRCA